MKKIIIYSLIVLLTSGRAFALDPLGPPTASLKKELPIMPTFWRDWDESQPTDFTFWRDWDESQLTDFNFWRDWDESQPTDSTYAVELEFIYGEMDLHAESLSMVTSVGTLQFSSAELKAIQTNKLYVNLVSVLGNNNDIFLRLGIMDTDMNKSKNRDNLAGYIGDSDYGFTVGGGIRSTFYQSEDGRAKWGLLAQFSYTKLDFDKKNYLISGSETTFSANADLLEMQLALGPNYEITDKLSVYGGPFLHFVRGDMELSGSIDGKPGRGSCDLEQESEIGCYVGLSGGLTKNSDFNIEYQLTDGAQAVGFRFIRRF
jgi:hypothetical protein